MIRESIQGRAWKVGSNVSTDSIAPGRLISLRANPKEYAQHVLEDARPDFAPNVKKDDILVADATLDVVPAVRSLLSLLKKQA